VIAIMVFKAQTLAHSLSTAAGVCALETHARVHYLAFAPPVGRNAIALLASFPACLKAADRRDLEQGARGSLKSNSTKNMDNPSVFSSAIGSALLALHCSRTVRISGPGLAIRSGPFEAGAQIGR
jgi:hypothetical protein